MEYYQAIQNRAAQTAAVVKQYVPELSVGEVTADQLLTLSQQLNTLAQQRNDALVAYDAANTEMQRSFTLLRQLVLALRRIDMRVARVVEHSKQSVEANVDARRLHQSGVVGVDRQRARGDLGADVAVREQHARQRIGRRRRPRAR